MGEGYQLIVTEKPSVARDIARVLGLKGRGQGWHGTGNVRVTWCVGHLVELAEPQTYDPRWKKWRLDLLPMLPERFLLKPRKSGRDQWAIVKKLLTDPELGRVVNACDAGREGELIFAFVYELSQCKAPVERLWISSMTNEAIRAGFSSLRPGKELGNLEAAARSRAEADWLVGLNATRAMTVRMGQGGSSALLSLGRVQTPTLALIDGREQAIRNFVPENFWQLKVQLRRRLEGPDKESWEAQWTGRDDKGKIVDRFFDKKIAEDLLKKISNNEGIITKVERKNKRERPPLLYDLTNLQKEANKRFGYSAKKTLDLAQNLYEKHKVLTYPRTDSRHLAKDQKRTIPTLFAAIAFGPYQKTAEDLAGRWPFDPGKGVIDDSEVSDHHAIIPTGTDPRKCALNADEKRIFDLVARRFLAVFCADALFAASVVETTICEELFVARGRMMLEPGWRAIDPPAQKKKEKPPPPMLPSVEQGEVVDQISARVVESVTKPPQRYSEATLLGAMERAGEELEEKELKRAMKRKGLGTPATRAAIIETLLSRGYIQRNKGKLLPTEQGSALLRALSVEVLRSPRLTGEWEARLAAVAEGEESREIFMRDIRKFVVEIVEQLRSAEPVVVDQNTPAVTQTSGSSIGSCPRCHAKVYEGPRGWGCSGCALMIPAQVARRKLSVRMAKKLLQEGRTEPVKGFRSREGKEFRAALLLEESGKVSFNFPQAESLGQCPNCHKPVRLRGKFYTCDSGRECPFIVPVEMQSLTIPREAVLGLLKNGKSETLLGFVHKTRPDDQETNITSKTFAGVLEWKGSRVVITPVDTRKEAGIIGSCPRCGAPVAFDRRRWSCKSCSFFIHASVARRELRIEEVKSLLERGRTERLYGFRQRSGAPFKAALLLDDKAGLKFDYSSGEESERPLPAGAPPPAFGERVDCPLCIARAEIEPGYVISGREAWGCSSWRKGCQLRVPFAPYGTEIPEEEARRLFSKQKTTKYLDQPIGPPGRRKICRIVLSLDESPCWALEPRRRTRRR